MQKGRVMPEALPIRDDIPPRELRRLARRESNGRVISRMLAIAHALDGMDRGQAARLVGMDRQTLRDWVIRFNALGVEGLRDRPKSGRRSWLDEGRLASLRALVLRGPDPERDGVSTWRAKDLCRIVEQRFGVTYSENGMLRLLHDLDLSWQKARPVHPEADLKAQARFKKNSLS
jgi:transposase